MAHIEKRKGKTGLLSYRITVSHNGVRKSETYRPKAKRPAAIRKEVEEEAARFEREWVSGSEEAGVTFCEYAARKWMKAAADSLTPAGYEFYTGIMQKRILPEIGHLAMSEIRPSHCQAMADRWADMGLSSATIKKYLTIARSVFTLALDAEVIDRDPTERVRVKKSGTDRRQHAWTPDQCKSFMDALESGFDTADKKGRRYRVEVSDKWRAFFALAIYGSFRRGEISCLQWGDVDPASHTITVRRAVQRVKGQTVIKEPKTRAGKRTITLPAVVFQYLDRLPRVSEWIFTRGGTVNRDALMYPLSASHVFKTYLSLYNRTHAVQLPDITLHDLRHTGATLLLENGVGIETVSRRLGHAKASVTLDVYGEALAETDKTAAEKLEEILSKK